jgi:deazaflavin-dependent oxidoreductase (nitroreductase family)
VSGICGGHWHVLVARNVPGISAFDDLADMWMKGMNVVHRGLFAVSGGRLGSAVMGMTAVELHDIGRASGRRRSVMLTAPIYEPERVVLVASKGGDDRHPDWYRNLVANPDVELTVGGTTGRCARTPPTRRSGPSCGHGSSPPIAAMRTTSDGRNERSPSSCSFPADSGLASRSTHRARPRPLRRGVRP